METLSYDDILLVPQLGVLDKRGDADLFSALTNSVEVGVPIISAPMPSVTEGRMAKAMLKIGAQAVIHRFQTIEARMEDWLVATTVEDGAPFVAIGLKEGMEAVEKLKAAGVQYLCLDVAHGHHQQVGAFMGKIKDFYPECQLMVGNVATPAGALFLAHGGADAIKVGIGPGAACRTREVTGFGVPQFTAIQSIRAQIDSWDLGIPIVADGGIKNSGDAVKAFVAGASTVMLGSLLAGADEAPKPGEYYGNASARLNGHHAPEGAEGSVPLTGPVENIIKELVWGIRSGISYAGGTDLLSLRENAEWIRVAPGVAAESNVRV